jgi:prepilin-type N-terminal cleavage/methylation domain-containing protein
MLIINKKLSHKGFTLIELMVSVVILAIAIFGIFQAYSTGFMGMADARDRTVATNYLREAIEDFKNMDFDQIKSTPTTPIPDTKFSRGTYVLKLEEIDGIVTLKKVITQVRWIDRKGNIKTEKISTIIYNKPATSEVGDTATKLVLYAQSYYSIMPTKEVNLLAEIKDENGNIYDWNGTIDFLVITDPANTPPVGSLNSSSVPAVSGVANCIFTAISEEELAALGGDVEGTERIEATATVDGKYLTDTVNIRVTTGPVGILIEPVSGEDDRVLAAGAGVESNLKLYVVKADYETHVAYDSPITLSADGPGTLSEITIASVDTDGIPFECISDGTPGIVEITASAPDLDIGYIEITFTGEPASILVTPDKKSIYPDEDIGITVTIVDVNNVPVSFSGNVNLSALPADYGSFNENSLSFTGQSSLDTTVFTADSNATPGDTITIQANAGDLSGSTEITILSSLTPYYLDIFVHPTSFDLILGKIYPTITATVYDENGTEIVTTYNTDISFIAKDKDGSFFGGFPLNNPENQSPIDGEVEVELFSTTAGTATITASSGSLILRPEGGIEVVFYETAHHIELTANPTSIEAGGHETSLITATVCDPDGNRVTNYGSDPDDQKTITLSLTEESKGVFINSSRTIELNEFDEGMVTTFLSSTEVGTATITAESGDGYNSIGYDATVEFTGNIPTEISNPFNVINWNDYYISFDLTVTGSPLYLTKINVEWNNGHAVLNSIIIRSPYDEEEVDYYTINANGSSSPYNNISIEDTLTIEKKSTIYLHFGDISDAAAKMKNNTVIVTLTDEDNIEYPPLSFKVP